MPAAIGRQPAQQQQQRATRYIPGEHQKARQPMDRSYQQSWPMQAQMQATGRSTGDIPYSVIQNAQARYESSRCFDADEDLEFNPCLTSEEYNACLAESSLSARSGRSEANSPPQSQTLPHSGIGANAYAQQAQVVHQQHQGFAGQAANGRGRKRNPIHIVDPRALQQQQASTGQWR